MSNRVSLDAVKRSLWLGIGLLMVAHAGSSCSPAEGGASGGNDTEIRTESASSKESFLEAYFGIFCALDKECDEYDAGYYRGETECLDETTKSVLSSQFWNSSTVQYHEGEGRTCLEAAATATCRTFEALIDSEEAPCMWVFRGDADAGEACFLDAECQRGLYCKLAAACPGTCEAMPSVGAPCPDDFCPGLTCHDGVCVERILEGEACGPDLPFCERGLSCEQSPDGTRVCTAGIEPVQPLGEGGTCDSDDDCRQALYCRYSPDGAVCMPRLEAGAECEAHDGSCAGGLHCSSIDSRFPGSCIDDVPLGGPCDEAFYDECAAGSCQEGTCRYRAALGEACAEHSTCYSGHCDDGQCAFRPPCFDFEPAAPTDG